MNATDTATGFVKPVAHPEANQLGDAGPCPGGRPSCRTGRQRVHKVAGNTLHCICDDCAEEWTRPGAFSALAEYASNLATALESAPLAGDESGRSLVIEETDVRGLVEDLRALAALAQPLRKAAVNKADNFGKFW